MDVDIINKILNLLGPREIIKLWINNNSLLTDVLTPKETKIKDEYMEQIDLALQHLDSDKIKDFTQRRQGEEALRELTGKFFQKIVNKIDINKMATLALHITIESMERRRSRYKEELNRFNMYEESFPTAIETLRKILDGKDIQVSYQKSGNTKPQMISSIDICAKDLYDSEGNIIGPSNLRSKRKRSKEIRDRKIENRKTSNKERLKEIDDELFETIIKNLYITDFYRCTYDSVGLYVSDEMILDLLGTEKENDWENIVTQATWKKMHNNPNRVSIMKEALTDRLEYVDMDKLLLASAFRIIQSLEKNNENEDLEKRKEFNRRQKEILEKMLQHINTKRKIGATIEVNPYWNNLDGSLADAIIYKTMNLQYDITRILPSGIYASEELIEETDEQLLNREKGLADVDKDLLKFMGFCEDDYIEYGILSEANFNYILDNYDVSNEKVKGILDRSESISKQTIEKLVNREKVEHGDIIELYTKGKISTQDVKDYIDSEEIIELYENKKINTQQLIEFYHYKSLDVETMGALVILNGIEKDMLEALDNKTVNFEEVKAISETGSIDYLDKNYIFSKYTDKNAENNFKTLEPLFLGIQCGKLTIEQLDELYTKYEIVKEEDLFGAALKGYFTSETIEALYLRSLISDEILDELSKQGIITEKFAQTTKNKLSIEKISSSYPFTGNIETVDLDDIYELPEGKIEREEGNGKTNEGGSKTEKGIEADYKLAVISNLGVNVQKISEDSFKYDRDNPFYNYEFFIIPEKDGEINGESIVIAERLYQNRKKQTGIPYGDATYLFTLKDLKRIGKKSKTEIREFMRGKKVDKEEIEIAEDKEESNEYNAYQGTKRIIHRSKFFWSTKLAKKIGEMLENSKTSIYTDKELEEIRNSPLMINELYLDSDRD